MYLDAYHAVFEKLWELAPVMDEQGTTGMPKVVGFTQQGKAAWVDWITDHYQEQNRPGFPDNLRGPWAKLVSYAARFALILHLCRRACGETSSEDVDEVSMAGASDLVDYFKSHVRRVYAQLHATPDDKRVVAAVAWIRRQPGRRATARDLQHAGVVGVRTNEEAQRLIVQLVERGYATSTETKVQGGMRVEVILT